MSNKIFKRTLLSSALGLLLGFQGMQDVSANVYSYADAYMSNLDYSVTSGDVLLQFEFFNLDANAGANGVYDPGAAYGFPYGNGASASATDSSGAINAASDAYSENDPMWDYVYASANSDSGLNPATAGAAGSDALLTFSFTAIGSGVIDLFAPLYYNLAMQTSSAGECGYAQTLGVMSVSMLEDGIALGGGSSQILDSIPTTCGVSPYQFTSGYTNTSVSLDLQDGATGYVSLYASALVKYFPEVTAELSSPASFGMLLLGLPMLLLALRRKENHNQLAA